MKKTQLVAFISLLLVFSFVFSACMDVKVILPNPTDAVNAIPETTTVSNVPETLPPVVTTEPPEVTTQKPAETTTSAPAELTPLQMSKGELLEFFNKNLNDIKNINPAFKRAKLTTVEDIVLSNQAANTLVGFVKSALLSEETEEKTNQKGASSVEIMSPDGERYVSQLTLSDIKDISVSTQGTSYVVTVTMPDTENPDKDTSAYAKIFNFITVDDVVNIYAPKVGATVERKNIKVNYSGCYAKATFSPDGKVEKYETYVTCVMSLLDATVKKVITINTDVDIKLASTTTFTNFQY